MGLAKSLTISANEEAIFPISEMMLDALDLIVLSISVKVWLQDVLTLLKVVLIEFTLVFKPSHDVSIRGLKPFSAPSILLSINDQAELAPAVLVLMEEILVFKASHWVSMDNFAEDNEDISPLSIVVH